MIKIKSEQAFRIFLLGIIVMSFIQNGYSQVTITNGNFTGGTTNMLIPSQTVNNISVNSSGITIAAINSTNRTYNFYTQSSSNVITTSLTIINNTETKFTQPVLTLPAHTFLNVTSTKAVYFL